MTMPRSRVVASLVIAAPFSLLLAGKPAAVLAGQSLFRSGVDGVTIQASVRHNNRPATGLTAADFELLDEGVPQEIRTLSVETVPVDITLLLDLSSSVDGPLLQRLKTAVSDTAALLREGDRIRLVAISQVLREVFDLRPRGEAVPLDTLTAEGATSLYDGLAATMMRPSEPGRRQLVVAFTDGRDSTSIIDAETAGAIARLSDAVVDIVVPTWNQTPESIRRLAQRNGALDSLPGTGNVVAGKGSSSRPPDPGFPPVLADLVSPTGGQVLPLDPGDSISRGFSRLLDDFRASYVLQYVPAGVAPGGWHNVLVSVKKGGKYDITARKGYRRQGTIP
jgi:VWFA-related protein